MAEPMGFFTDTTVCIGCKACEVACKEWNLVPEDGLDWSGDSYDNTLPPDGYYSLAYPNHFQAGELMGSDGKKAADADFTLDLLLLRAITYKHVGGIRAALVNAKLEEAARSIVSAKEGKEDYQPIR